MLEGDGRERKVGNIGLRAAGLIAFPEALVQPHDTLIVTSNKHWDALDSSTNLVLLTLPCHHGQLFHFSALVCLCLKKDNCKLINHLPKKPSLSRAQK